MTDIPAQTTAGGIQQFKVDIRSLDEFGTFLSQRLNDTLAPLIDHMTQELAAGGDIGPNLPSDDLQMMNRVNASCATAMVDQLHAFKCGTTFLADAAHAIAARYSSSDALSRATISDVDPAMTTALRETAREESS